MMINTRPPVLFYGGIKSSTFQTPTFQAASPEYPIPNNIHPDQIKPWIFTTDRKPVLANITGVSINDAEEINHWFNNNPDTPGYTDKKYHQWWVNLVNNNGVLEEGTQTFALRYNDKILGMIFIEDRQIDQYDSKMTTLLRGVRIAPEMNTNINPNAPYKGIGKALLIQAIAESVRLETSGVGLTSSHGVEDYYTSIFGQPVMTRQHEDDPAGVTRSYYILKDNKRNAMLRQLQAQSHRLQSQWESSRKPDISLAFRGYLELP